MDKNPRPLGAAQLELLDTLKASGGYWYHGCGWHQRSNSATIKTLDTLVKRELVKVGETASGTTYTLREEAACQSAPEN